MTKYKRKFGDRKDARLCRNIGVLNQILIDLKPKRSLAELYIDQPMDVTKLVKYVDDLKKENPDLTYFHAIVTLLGKVIYNRKKINFFIANHKMYDHNDVIISFVIKPKFDDKSEEVMALIPIKENDNILSVSKRVKNEVNKFRSNKLKLEGANSALQIFGKLPNFLRIPLINFIQYLDRKGKVPKSLIKDNLYYSSMIISDIGTFKCKGIYHNITDFGTCSSIVIMGEIEDKEVIKNGKKEIRKMCDIGITIDERIADGFYMVKTLKLAQYIINNPKLLEREISEKVFFEE